MDKKICRMKHWVGLRSLGRHDLVESLRYGSPMTARLILALAAMIYAVLTLLHPDLSWRDTSMIVQRNAPSLPIWVAMFTLDSLCLWWRIFDSKPRIYWAWAINIATFSLWFSVVGVTTKTLGYLFPNSVGEIILCLIAAWVTFRVDWTRRDKETA